MSRLGFDEACPKTPTFLTPQVADSKHSIFLSFACPKSDDFGPHSSKGIMGGTLGRDDVKLMGVGILDYSNDQAAQLRATLLRCAVRQEVAQNVMLSGSRCPNA